MKKNKIKIAIFILCVCTSFVLIGCKQQTIKFHRESKFSELMNKFGNEENKKKVLKKSSGVIIYKDNSNNTSGGVNFGPGEINFDLPIKFK